MITECHILLGEALFDEFKDKNEIRCSTAQKARFFQNAATKIILCISDTQLLHQQLHIYKLCKTLRIKTLKTLRHVSVLRPSSGSYIFLAKVTLEIVTY